MVPDRIERETLINAPSERVWALITEAQHLGRWFGDAGAEIDLRPGGAMTDAKGDRGKSPSEQSDADLFVRLAQCCGYCILAGVQPAARECHLACVCAHVLAPDAVVGVDARAAAERVLVGRVVQLRCVVQRGLHAERGVALRPSLTRLPQEALQRRPHVRGVAMNPVDHPHGGGEGKSGQGNPHPVSPWGLPTKGYKTRNSKKTDKYIIARRKSGVRNA